MANSAVTTWKAGRSRAAEVSSAAGRRESLRARRYPIARWYLRPAAARLAELLAPTRVRPWHLTLCGLLSAIGAAAVLTSQPVMAPLAAVLVLGYWFFDRADGLLARRQQTASAFGAWLDANVDELVDVGLHVAAAAVIARQAAASWPWLLLAAFLAGKYLLMYGLLPLPPGEGRGEGGGREGACQRPLVPTLTLTLSQRERELTPLTFSQRERGLSFLRRAYHLPGNADVRVHLLAAALATGWLTAELVVVAVYYNLRWLARYVLVARRLRGAS